MTLDPQPGSLETKTQDVHEFGVALALGIPFAQSKACGFALRQEAVNIAVSNPQEGFVGAPKIN